jgi:hypothetical protein
MGPTRSPLSASYALDGQFAVMASMPASSTKSSAYRSETSSAKSSKCEDARRAWTAEKDEGLEGLKEVDEGISNVPALAVPVLGGNKI